MINFQEKYDEFRESVELFLATTDIPVQPKSLYEPVRYVISGGGKRLRPVLTMFTCNMMKGNTEEGLIAGAALELLHNFTLVHDDIMDNADTRRGRLTVHKKWDYNTAVLAGDQLIALGYNILFGKGYYIKNINRVADTFTKAIIEVCEGQSYDKDFELHETVTMDEYLMMITKKTAMLLEACALIGGIIADASEEELGNLSRYAINTGIAFQILDDLLDVIGDEKTFGKKPGGDIREGKKTYLYIKALEGAKDAGDKKILKDISQKNPVIREDDFFKVASKVYEKTGAIDMAEKAIKQYTDEAYKYLHNIPGVDAEPLSWFADMLLKRKY